MTNSSDSSQPPQPPTDPTPDAQTPPVPAEHPALTPQSRPAVGGPVPGTPEHTAAGGTYPDVDPSPAIRVLADRWPHPQDALDALYAHAMTTHGLAHDKQMMLDVVEYFAAGLARLGIDVAHPSVDVDHSQR